jgi:hypothetical protein
MSLRARSRRLCCAATTLLRRRPNGFFIPCRTAGDAHDAQHAGYAALEPLFRAAEPRFQEYLDQIDAIADPLLAIGSSDATPQPRWNQDWFPRLDAAAAYALVRTRAPARLVEVGCGHSTRFFIRAIADAGLATRVTAIDPSPRAALAGLPVEAVAAPLQMVSKALFSSVSDGDVLSLDGSHILMPGTDVDIFLNHILPRLPDGVCVHFHDIFLPDAYPAAWAWRGYNEQSAVAALLQGGGWQMLWSSRWVATRMPDAVRRSVVGRLPLLPGAYESSLWLEKRALAAPPSASTADAGTRPRHIRSLRG